MKAFLPYRRCDAGKGEIFLSPFVKGRSLHVQAPIAFRAIIEEELAPGLSPHQRELLKLVGMTDYLAYITVANRERVAGRLTLQPDKADAVAELIQSLGVHCRRSEFDIWTRRKLVEGTVHQGSLVPRGTQDGAEAVLHLSVDKEIAERLDAVEINNEHALIGRLFGYPACCTRKFAEITSAELDKTAGGIPGTGPFPKALNPIFRYLYGLNLLFHFPCTPECKASMEIHQQRRQYLRGLSASTDAYDTLASGIAFYGPEVGIALVTKYRQLDEDTYLAQELVTRSKKSIERFSGNGDDLRIQLRSQHAFRIGDDDFDSRHQFAARFI